MLKKLFVIALVLTISSSNLIFAQSKQKVSLLLFNGKIFTADRQFSLAEAVAVDGEKILVQVFAEQESPLVFST